MGQEKGASFTFLSKYLRNLGNIFFRWRSYIPLILIPLLLLEADHFHLASGNDLANTIYELLCLLISLSGEFVRIITIGFVPPGTSGRNTKSQRATALNTTGIYSITRNPLYLGNYLIIFGITLLSQSWELVVINSLLFIMFYTPIILVEEEFLLDKFGDEYRDYVFRVPCFFPGFSLWVPAESGWSWRMVLRREYGSTSAVILSFVLIKHLRLFVIAGEARADLPWLVFGGAGMLMWLIIRFLSKYTSFLNERRE